MKKNESTLTVMMNEPEARSVVKRINDDVIQDGALLLDFKEREGWRAMGYTSFKACCEIEFPDIFGRRAQIYRLMDQSEVSKNVPPIGRHESPIHVSTQVSRELKKLPVAEQRAAFEEAGGAKATGKTTKAVVENRKKKAKKKAPASPATNPKYLPALERIGRICDKRTRANIENGIFDHVTEREAIYWAGLKDHEMADIQELVVAKRFTPSHAHKILSKIITASSKIEEMLNQALAMGGSWDGDVDGFHITVTKKSKKR